MRLLTWNMRALMGISAARVDAYEQLFESASADVLLLQEAGLKGGGWGRLAAMLETLGYKTYNPAPIVENPGGTDSGCAICVRGELEASAPDWVSVPWPELLARATVTVGGFTFDVISAHIPNAIGAGWIKIDYFEELARRLAEPRSRPLSVAGDFNEPRIERPEGRMLTKAYEDDDAGGVYMPETYTVRGHTDTCKRWDDGVRSVLDTPNPAGLHDVFRRHRGPTATEATFGSADAPQQIDHVLMSPEFHTSGITFGHDWRGKGLSDHSAVWVDFEFE